MKTVNSTWQHSVRMLVVAICVAVGASCSTLENSGMAGAAQDQIMLVRADPPSLGYLRLHTQINRFSDISLFIKKNGLPDFLAETGNRDRQYFILYYLKERRAFACRTRSNDSKAVEFAGPYPVTAREQQILTDFKRDPTKRPENW